MTLGVLQLFAGFLVGLGLGMAVGQARRPHRQQQRPDRTPEHVSSMARHPAGSDFHYERGLARCLLCDTMVPVNRITAHSDAFHRPDIARGGRSSE